jgi:UDP-N-acetylmuramate--alanine ligase
VIGDRTSGESRTLAGVELPMVGAHNVQNALAGIAIAQEIGIEDEVIRRALTDFKGVKRRFTETGVVNGITIIDDYGHHPVEIGAVLAAARAGVAGKVVAIVQPHRYSRLADLFEEFCTCFNDADTVIVADVYAAGEEPIEGIDRDALVAGLQARGHRDVVPLDAPGDLARIVSGIAAPGDIVVCLGAGNITQWANALPAELEAQRKKKPAKPTGKRS